jgi:hypothetical protein
MARTIELNASPTWADVRDDYTLRYQEHVIGRMRRLTGDGWEWHITVPMAMPAWANGSAPDFDGCRVMFAEAWGRFLKETNPARLERAWELSRAAERRLHNVQSLKTGEAGGPLSPDLG